MSNRLSPFAGEKYLNIETYRKTGQAVRTPVWFVENGGALYVRTSEETGKYKRIRNNSNVRIAPCDFRGNVKGEWVKAEAGPAPEEKAQLAYKLLEQKYGVMYKLARMIRRTKYTMLEIRVSGE